MMQRARHGAVTQQAVFFMPSAHALRRQAEVVEEAETGTGQPSRGACACTGYY